MNGDSGEVIGMAASVTFLVTGNATIQLASEPDYRGRVTALWSMAFNGSTPIGAVAVGRAGGHDELHELSRRRGL
jgi:hypothetical protein